MSGTAKEWIIVLVFWIVVIALTIGEAFWLYRRRWSGFGRSLLFSLLTNFIGFFAGFIVLFVILGVVLAMAWDGSLANLPLGDAGIWVMMIFALLFTPIFLALCKRLFLSIFKIGATGKTTWIFSLASSFAIFFVAYGAPILFGYALYRFL